eukprot:NODE_250_length_11764_cov_1.155594.p1 type:complete len:242 gc:universal NODE_250_length_11764_cov_1.155594:10396-11121(+)
MNIFTLNTPNLTHFFKIRIQQNNIKLCSLLLKDINEHASSFATRSNVSHSDPVKSKSYYTNKCQIKHLLCICSLQEFRSITHHLPNKKSPGPDEIPNELIKHYPTKFLRLIYDYFKLLILKCITPSQFNLILLHPLQKQDDPGNVLNYRVLALSANLKKLFERTFIESLGELTNKPDGIQYAYRKHHSVHNAISTIIDHIQTLKVNSTSPIILFCADITKAFDHLSRHFNLTQLAQVDDAI